MTNSDFHSSLSQKSDQELTAIITTRRGFSEEYLTEAENILRERGYEINVTEEKEINPPTTKSISNDEIKKRNLELILILLLVVAIELPLLLPFDFFMRYFHFYQINYYFFRLIILSHLVFGFWSFFLMKKHKFVTWPWVITGFLFGHYSMFFLCIAIWTKKNDA